MRSHCGCSRSVFPSIVFSSCQRAVFLHLVGRTTHHRATRHLEALVLTRQSRAVRFERLTFGYYCSAGANNRLACRVFQRLGGGGGYDDSVPGKVTKTTPSGDRTT